MTPPELNQLINRYQKGTATSEERQWLENYWQQSLTKQSAIWDLSPAEQISLQQRIYRKTINQIQNHEPGAFRPIRQLHDQHWMLIAASFVGFLLLFAAGWFWVTNQQVLDVTHGTRYGEKKQVILPDSSVVWLNSNSSLHYAPDDTGSRQVWLVGEALFSVKHTPTHRKFIVHTTHNLNIEVLGTVFNVLDRRGNLNIILQSGSVRVTDQRHRQADIMMQPGDMVHQTLEHPLLAKTSVQATTRTTWKDGVMYVENKPLGELFAWIEDTYGLHVECSPALRLETFAGRVPTDSIHSFFTMIPKLYQVRMQRDGRTYRITTLADTPN